MKWKRKEHYQTHSMKAVLPLYLNQIKTHFKRCHLPQCAWKGESLQQQLWHRRTLSKQSLWGQVSAKLTPEICINNASSKSRLTAAGRQATDADTIHRTLSRLFIFSLSLPLMRKQPNNTCILKNLLKLYCI
jgi:hypothetical protein